MKLFYKLLLCASILTTASSIADETQKSFNDMSKDEFDSTGCKQEEVKQDDLERIEQQNKHHNTDTQK